MACLMRCGPCYNDAAGAPAMRSVLCLPPGLVDSHLDRQDLARSAVARPAQRSGAQIVEPDCHSHMRVGCAQPFERVEPYPAEHRNESFGPGVAGGLHTAVLTA